MRLWAKMALCMLLVLGVLFALCGYALTDASFQSALDDATQQSVTLHTQQKTTTLRALCMARDASVDGALQDYDFSAAAKQALDSENTNATGAVLTQGYAALYNTLPTALGKTQQAELMRTPGSRQILRAGENTYLAMASPVVTPERTVYLMSAFDITDLFVRRAQETRLFWQLYTGMMLMAAMVCIGMAAWFTRPVARLNRAAKAVAQGAYDQCVLQGKAVRTSKEGDEIAQLGHSFDAMAQAVQEKVASLELSVRQREDFMSAFTHELKTPMTAMMGYAALLQRDNIPSEMRSKALRYLHSETKRLEALSQKLLMLLGLSDEEISMGSVTMPALFDAAKAALPEETTRRNPVRFTVFAGTPDAVGDADLLVDVLRNLIENAARASAEGVAVEVCARGAEAAEALSAKAAEPLGDAGLEREKGLSQPIATEFASHHLDCTACGASQTPVPGVCICVSDLGCGIPESELARVTEPFYSVNKSRSRAQGGSGLGLSICDRIARLHGARLTLINRTQGGVEASVVLRAVVTSAPADAAKAAPAAPNACAALSKPEQTPAQQSPMPEKEANAHAQNG